MKKRSHFVYFDGRKAVDIWGDNPEGWTNLTGTAETTQGEYYKFIPTLFRGVQLRSYAVATMPFQIKKRKRVIDSSSEWTNEVGFLPNPNIILQQIESALSMFGACYEFRDHNQYVTKGLQYHVPTTITPKLNLKTREIISFDRPVDGVVQHFGVDDYVYFWPPDPTVEYGPAANFPVKAAFNACGLLYNLDIFSAEFAKRGLVKATLLTVKGMPNEADRTRLEDWWNRFLGGVKNAGRAKVFNAEAIDPKVIGEGFKELENVTIGQEKREDIAIALGIPMSILFANAANYATSQQDEINFLQKTVIPECEFIESVLNEQLFDDLGLRWEFLPETLDALQADEADRAQSLKTLVDAGLPLIDSMDLLGYEISDELRAKLEAEAAAKEKRAEEMEARLTQTNPQQAPGGAANQAEPPPSSEEQPEEPAAQPAKSLDPIQTKELGQWQKKSIRALNAGEGANVEFETFNLPRQLQVIIHDKLARCETEDDIKAAFTLAAEEYRQPDIAAIVEMGAMHLEALSKVFTNEPAAN